MYKKASKLKLKFPTSKGVLSVEQLWDLSQSDLSQAVKAVKKTLNTIDNDDDLSFLDSSKVIDVENQLRFEILKDVYLTKKSEIDDAKEKATTKANNQRINELIARKQEMALENLSIEELEKLIK